MFPKQVIIQSLADNPRKNYPTWRSNIRQAASDICADEYPLGLLHLVTPDDIHHLFEDADGNVVPPASAEAPDDLPGNASAANVKTHEQLHQRFLRFNRGKATLKTLIVESLGDILRRTQANEFTNVVQHDTNTIVANMEAMFGTHTRADIEELHRQLLEPCPGQDQATFLDFSTSFTETLQRLSVAGQPVDAYTQVSKFMAATSAQPALTDAIIDYVKLTPDLAEQNLPDLIDYMRVQLSNLTMSRAGFAGASIAPTPLTHADVRTMLNEAFANFAAVAAQAPPAQTSSTRATARRTPHVSPHNRQYCYKHGCIGHTSAQCQFMSTRPQEFTRAMRNAKTPTDVPGGAPN